MEKETRKALNFDLDTKALKTYYCKTNNPLEVLGAYREIKKFQVYIDDSEYIRYNKLHRACAKDASRFRTKP